MELKQIFIYLMSFIVISCSSEKNVRTYKLEKNQISSESKSNDLKTDSPNELNYVKPKTWTFSSGSSMRLLSFSIPYSMGMADLSLIKLNSTGGGLELNVNRWRKQLDLSALNINEIMKEINVIETINGNYEILEIINEEDGRAFLCAIFSLDESTYFVKVTLNVKGISEIKSDFIKFCSSLKFPK